MADLVLPFIVTLADETLWITARINVKAQNYVEISSFVWDKTNFMIEIDDRVKRLRHRASLLEKFRVNLTDKQPIEPIGFTIYESELVNRFQFLENINKAPFVYFFELENNGRNIELCHELSKYRTDCKSGKKSGAVVKLPKNASENKGTTLYVGSVKNNIHKRIMEHLGNGYPLTYSLKLNEWFPPDLKIILNCIQLTEEFECITGDIEAILHESKAPLFGKRAE
jgi:hypothetical protein